MGSMIRPLAHCTRSPGMPGAVVFRPTYVFRMSGDMRICAQATGASPAGTEGQRSTRDPARPSPALGHATYPGQHQCSSSCPSAASSSALPACKAGAQAWAPGVASWLRPPSFLSTWVRPGLTPWEACQEKGPVLCGGSSRGLKGHCWLCTRPSTQRL